MCSRYRNLHEIAPNKDVSISMPNKLDAALNPKSVAVVGASDNPHKVGGRPILFMRNYGFKGQVYPINPARATVQGYKAYPDLASLP